MKKLALAVSLLALTAVTAQAQSPEYRAMMKARLAAGGGAPTGIDVPGCTYRAIFKPGNEAFRQICSFDDTRDSMEFWQRQQMKSGGGNETAPTP